jgi:hypothetical protein
MSNLNVPRLIVSGDGFKIVEEVARGGVVVYVNDEFDSVHADEAHAKVRVQRLGLHDFHYLLNP